MARPDRQGTYPRVIVDNAQRRAHNRFRFPSESWAPTKDKQATGFFKSV